MQEHESLWDIQLSRPTVVKYHTVLIATDERLMDLEPYL